MERLTLLMHDRDDNHGFPFDAKYDCIGKTAEQTAPSFPKNDRPCGGIVTDSLECIAEFKYEFLA